MNCSRCGRRLRLEKRKWLTGDLCYRCNPDWSRITKSKGGERKNRVRGTGNYSSGYHRIAGQQIHRKVWEEKHGPIPLGLVVHHLNGDTTDNHIGNLCLMMRGAHAIHHNCGENLTHDRWGNPRNSV